MPRLFLTPATKGRRIVLWSLACFAVSQLALSAYLDQRRPELRDPVYALRLESLRTRLAQSPRAPLMLLLGSSRVKYSVRPGDMSVCTATGETPVIYNFGINALGPIRALIYLRRLLADGIRPDNLLMEVWPPLLTQVGIFDEASQIPVEDDIHWRDVPLMGRYFGANRTVLHHGLRNNLLPVSVFRSSLLDAAIPFLVPAPYRAATAEQVREWRPDDEGGWFPIPERWQVNTPQRRRGIEREAEGLRTLMDPLILNPRAGAALRELLAECRRHGIQTTLILLPEHSRMRSWYTPRTWTMFRAYLSQLQDEHPVPIVDTRTWAADADFADDYLHMQASGVPAFSERLGREVVQPLMQGTALAPHVLFTADSQAR